MKKDVKCEFTKLFNDQVETFSKLVELDVLTVDEANRKLYEYMNDFEKEHEISITNKNEKLIKRD